MTDRWNNSLTSATATKLLAVILLFGVALRLFGVNAPIADDQSWNQVSAATVIRQFVENGIDFFHPQWDVLHRGSALPRIEAEEAPIYHVLSAIPAKVFGFIPLFARLVSIAFGTLAGLYLFLLVRRKTDDSTALAATFFFVLAPYPLYFFRAIMSESAMVFAMIAALYHFDRYCDTETFGQVMAAALFTCLAGLFKPFALHIGVPILIMALVRFRWRILTRPALYLYVVIALAPPLAWVAWAAKIGTLGGVTYDGAVASAPHLWGKWSLLWDPSWYYRLQWRQLDRMATPVVPLLVLAAVILPDARKKAPLFLWWLAGVAVYIGLVRQGNFIHNYYQLPAAAPFAALAATGLFGIAKKLSAKNGRRLVGTLMAVFFVVSLIYALPHFRLDLSSDQAGKLAAQYTAPGEKLLVMDPGATRKNQVLWAAHRQGWHFQNLKVAHVKEYKELGAAVVVLVLEPSQIKKAAEVRQFLAAESDFLVVKSGALGKRGEHHEIRLYRLQ